MLRTILVPLDGSRFAEFALPLASQLARQAGAELRLALVHQIIPAWSPVLGIPESVALLESESRTREHTYVAGVADGLRTGSQLRVQPTVLDGIPATALVTEAERTHADLIVMATHGRGAISRFWLGSVADYMLRHCSVPMLLVRPKRGEELPSQPPPTHSVLIPLDLSESSEAILEPATMLGLITQAHYTLIHVIEPMITMGEPALPYPAGIDAGLIDTRREEAQKHLDAVADRMRGRGLSVSTRVLIAMGSAATILDMAEREHFDLIAMTTHGAGGFRRFVLGSVADKVVRGSEKPVLAFRPKES